LIYRKIKQFEFKEKKEYTGLRNNSKEQERLAKLVEDFKNKVGYYYFSFISDQSYFNRNWIIILMLKSKELMRNSGRIIKEYLMHMEIMYSLIISKSRPVVEESYPKIGNVVNIRL
jgi:hypothetical protein